MVMIDFGDYKIRFDPNEVRISIDGDMIDIGARSKKEFPELNDCDWAHNGLYKINEPKKRLMKSGEH